MPDNKIKTKQEIKLMMSLELHALPKVATTKGNGSSIKDEDGNIQATSGLTQCPLTAWEIQKS